MKQLTLPNGKTCFYLDRLTAFDTYREVYEEREYFRFGLTIPENGIVFDVGANIGQFSRYVAERYPSSRVYGFEPVPQIFSVYSANVREYADRVHPYNLGLAEKEDEVTIEYFPRLSADSSIVPFEWKEKAGFYAAHWKDFTQGNRFAWIVPAALRPFAVNMIMKSVYRAVPAACRLRPLSALIAELDIPRIDFLKVDAENYEEHVIAGIADAHWPLIRQVAMEVHQHIPGGGGLVDKFTALLESKGFTVNIGAEFMAPGSDVFMLYAKRDGV